MRWINKTRKLDKMIANLQALESKKVAVGFFNKYYGVENNNLPVAQVAQWQEEGVPANNIPPRPMFRTYLFSKVTGSAYKILFKVLLKNLCDGTMTPTAVLKSLGENLQEDLKQIIQDGVAPANVAWWAALKNNLPPLTHTGFMRESVEYKITDRNGVV